MARREARLGEDRSGGERQRRLRDIVAGPRLQLAAELADVLLGGGRPDQHAVAARPVDLLDDQLLQVVEHVFQRVRVGTPPRRHVLQQRLLARVELHDLRHVAVDGLVVRHPRPRRVGDGDAARAIDVEDARHAELAVRPEVHRVEVIVVHPAIQHVDLLVALRRPHRHAAVHDPQIVPLHQLDAHLVGEEGMLVIRGIVDARRQHGHHRIALAFHRRAGGEARMERLGIAADALHLVGREQLREHAQHRFAVLQHVADAGRRAGIVLQDVELLRPGADQVDADDVGVDAARRLHPDHLAEIGVVAGDHLHRQAPRPDDLLTVVDVVQEGVERAYPLLDTLRQLGPFAGRDDARHDVERDQPLARLGLAIDVEGDAGQAENRLRLAGLGAQVRWVLGGEPRLVSLVSVADRPVGTGHLIEWEGVCHRGQDVGRGAKAQQPPCPLHAGNVCSGPGSHDFRAAAPPASGR